MEITGSQIIPAAPDVVWKALIDPAVLERCLPGCESVERIDDERFRAVIAAVIGPLRARFNGNLRIAEADPPRSCVMSFEGQGGAVGFCKGSASVTLEESSGGTELAYTAKAEVGGKLAQVGSRLVDGVAKKLADDFFVAFRGQLVPVEATAAPRDESVPAPPPRLPAALGHAESSRTTSIASARTPAATNGPVMVPGWWLAVAVVLGSVATAVGTFLSR
jgi:carbon monoxide dehydrogenase subunit G